MNLHYCPCGFPRTTEACATEGVSLHTVEYDQEHREMHLTAFPDASDSTRRYLDHRINLSRERDAKSERWETLHHDHLYVTVVVAVAA
jgi:hypothetical protein